MKTWYRFFSCWRRFSFSQLAIDYNRLTMGPSKNAEHSHQEKKRLSAFLAIGPVIPSDDRGHSGWIPLDQTSVADPSDLPPKSMPRQVKTE